MSSKFWIEVAVVALVSLQALAQNWEFSEEEKLVLREGTLRYVIDKPGYLELDMCSGCEGEFDRLEVIASKDAKGQPDLPYRIKVFKDRSVRETSVIPHKDLTWKTPIDILFVDRNPFPGLGEIGDAGDEGNAISDGIARVEEKGGRRNVTLKSLRRYNNFIELKASGEGRQDHIPGVGTRTVPQWPIFDGGLMLRQRHTELMRSDARFLKFLPTQKYICSWAMYEADEPKSGWIESAAGKEHPFVLRVRIWKMEEERLTRANALCIARVSGCAKMIGSESIKIDCEKGGKDFSLKMLAGSLGETSRTLRLRYKNAEVSEGISSDISIDELEKREEKFREDCKKRVEAKTGKPLK